MAHKICTACGKLREINVKIEPAYQDNDIPAIQLVISDTLPICTCPPEKIVKVNKRDIQFADFAEKLWNELGDAIRLEPGFIPDGKILSDKYLPIWKQLIARRAYDLVYTLVEQLNEFPPIEDHVEDI